MPDQNVSKQDNKKFQLQHKLFAAVERMIKETRVYNIDLEQDVSVSLVNPVIETQTHPLYFNIPANINGLPVTIETETYEIVEGLAKPQVHDANAGQLEAKINDVPADIVKTADVRNVPVRLSARVTVKDFFKEYKIKPRLHYSTPVKSIDFKRLKPAIKQITPRITAQVKENSYAFRRLTVEQPAVELSFLTEKEQLVFWKKAVEKTRKEPRKLRLIGVYSSVAYDCIENVKINFAQKRLTYNFKSRIPRDRGRLRDIALFRDLDTDKSVMVRK